MDADEEDRFPEGCGQFVEGLCDLFEVWWGVVLFAWRFLEEFESFLVARRRAEVVAGGIEGDFVDPGFEFGAEAILWQCVRSFDEGLLGNVVRRAGVAAELPGIRVDGVIIAVEENTEGGFAALRRKDGQI